MIRLNVNNHIMLESLRESDAHELFSLTELNRVYLRKWLPWLDSCREVADSITYIRKSIQGWKNKKSLVLGIKVNRKLAGVLGIHEINWDDRTGKLGYWLSEQQQGQGIMISAVTELTNFSFNILSFKSLYIHIAVHIVQSQTIPKKLNFTYISTVSKSIQLYNGYFDQDIYKMSSDDWLK